MIHTMRRLILFKGSGFSLLELLICVCIISIVSTIYSRKSLFSEATNGRTAPTRRPASLFIPKAGLQEER